MRMRLVAATLLLLSAAGAAKAQEIHMGMIGGPSFSHIDFEDPDDALDARIGVTAGIYAVIGAAGWFALQSELVMSQKGLIYPAEDPQGNQFEATYGVGYVEIPVFARVSYPRWSVRPFVLAGPVAAYRATAQYMADDYLNVDARLDTEKFDLGIAGGAGIEFYADNGAIQVGARYNHGLFDVDDSEADLPGKNRSLSFVIGFARVLGRGF